MESITLDTGDIMYGSASECIMEISKIFEANMETEQQWRFLIMWKTAFMSKLGADPRPYIFESKEQAEENRERLVKFLQEVENAKQEKAKRRSLRYQDNGPGIA